MSHVAALLLVGLQGYNYTRWYKEEEKKVVEQ